MQPDGIQDEPSAMTPLDPGPCRGAEDPHRAGRGGGCRLWPWLAARADAFRALPVPGLAARPPRSCCSGWPRPWSCRAGAIAAGAIGKGEDEIEIRRGRLVRVRTIVPFGRVQHIDVAQGPIQRPFGLGTLILHTAGTQRRLGAAAGPCATPRPRRCATASAPRSARIWCERAAPAPEPRRLHPATLIVRWLKIVPQMLAGGIGLAATSDYGGLGASSCSRCSRRSSARCSRSLSWWRFRYTIGPGEIVIEKGVLQRQRRVIPFDRVQDIAIERGLLARLFGTARVRIETGGAAKDEGELDMIALAEAHALRDLVRHGARAAEAHAEAPARAEPVLFAMDGQRLLLSGLFGFSLVFLAAIAALVQQLDQFGLVDWDEWFTAERAEAAAGW